VLASEWQLTFKEDAIKIKQLSQIVGMYYEVLI
jgi:hypothetical protein